MLSARKTRGALEAKRDTMLRSRDLAARQASQVAPALAGLALFSASAVRERLSDVPWPGALPTDEHDSHRGQAVPFGQRFANHEQARAWALRTLRDQPTFAADGSQIAPLSEFSLPIAAAQVGWYLNHHSADGRHEKDLRIEVFVGQELRSGEEGTGETHVETRRFQMETEATVSFMQGWQESGPRPVCFLDGPLVVSFASPYSARRRPQFVQPVSRLIEAAEAMRFPLVGYVASSAANDTLHMLHALGLLAEEPRIGDAATLGALLPAWGDRSVTYLCARDDNVLRTYARADGSPLSDQIAYCYLHAESSAPPARLELPRWLAEDSLELARVLDIVRAECLIGLGYPYAIETADETAVLTARDREQFKRLVAGFAATLDIELRPTPKARSKSRRR